MTRAEAIVAVEQLIREFGDYSFRSMFKRGKRVNARKAGHAYRLEQLRRHLEQSP